MCWCGWMACKWLLDSFSKPLPMMDANGGLNARHRLLQMVLSMTLMSVVHTGYSEARYRDA